MKNLARIYWVSLVVLMVLGCKKDKSEVECTPTSTSENMGYVKRVVYGTSSNRQNMELYLPNGYTNNTKVVILVHGGGWILGPNETDTTQLFSGDLGWNLVNKLLENGYGAAVIKYRLACYTTNSTQYTNDPMLYMKDMQEDVHLAISKLKTEAVDSGFSSTEFALLGESAGAHISLMYALKNWSDPALKTVISFYSPYSIDEQQFKSNGSSFPFNALPANLGYGFGVERKVNSCNFSSTGNINLFFAMKTLANYNMSVSSATPDSIVDSLSFSAAINIQRNLPTFILHGSADALVPSAHSDSLIKAITNKFGTTAAGLSDFSSPHKMLKYIGCNHGFGGCNQTPIMNDVITWLNSQM